MTSYPPEARIMPEVTPDTEAFWTGGKDGELLIYKCRSCGHFFHPPAPACWRCASRDVGPEAASGQAVVATYTINRHPWLPGFPPPYIVAIVELAEERDVRLTTNIVDLAVEDVKIGMPVEVVFEHREDIWLPLFKPVSA